MKKAKKQLIRLFETRDVRRRRKLYEYYVHCFEQQHSTNFTIELINTDLGRQLVGKPDIKYIRAHCHLWLALQADQQNIHQEFETKSLENHPDYPD